MARNKGKIWEASAIPFSEECEFPEGEWHQPPTNPLRRKHRPKLATAPFLAWDGEGYTDDNGKHHYMLFGNSAGEYVEVGDKPLDWSICFPLLLMHPNEINIIYGGDYDIIKMIQTLPLGRRKRIMQGKWTVFDRYSIQWLRKKFLRIKDKDTNTTVTLYDVLPFFQTSFVKACREYLGESPELDRMLEMKLRRDSFALGDPEVMPYWQSELDYLVKLMDTFRRLLAEVDIVPSRGWYGPGAIANRLMSKYDMRRYYGGIPAVITDLAERAYYGGRFEQFKIGRFEQAYEYDIRSAYPTAIAMLPDFSRAVWDNVPGDIVPAMIDPFGLYCVSWRIRGTGHPANPFPWRDTNGAIYFPPEGHRSWYWGIEVQAAIERFRNKRILERSLTIHEAWIPTLPMDCDPFYWVPEIYELRAKLRAEGNAAQKGLKLGLNSLYGKIAQSVGAIRNEGEWRKPTWHHALWAGWITAYCRAKIMQAIGQRTESLIAIETDAVFVTEPIDELTLGEALGEWERTDLDSILYIRSGIYHAITDKGLRKIKSRGVESAHIHSEDYWLDVFSTLPYEQRTITSTVTRFGTDLRQPWRFGNWYSQTISVRLPDVFGKRVHVPRRCRACELGDSYADSPHDLICPQPFIDSATVASTPYRFPWREDVTYKQPNRYDKGEHIERLGETVWE